MKLNCAQRYMSVSGEIIIIIISTSSTKMLDGKCYLYLFLLQNIFNAESMWKFL